MSLHAYIYHETPSSVGSDLFFVFHGTGGDEMQFPALARELMPHAHVISPRGDVSEHGALRFFKRTGEGVYDMPDLEKRTAAMATFIAAHKDRLKPKRVTGLGYSNGANILASVIFQNPSLFDDAILMHPLVPFAPPALLKKPRVLITAGKRDQICPPELTEALAVHLSAEIEWHEGGHEIRPSEISAARRFLAG
jgi:phospholipase/carboxylesterase